MLQYAHGPLSAILALAAQHGVRALVGALGGDDLVSSAGGDIMAALIAGESRIFDRLDAMERRLEEVLEQRFTVELSAGSRFFLDAMRARTTRRKTWNVLGST